MSQATRTPIVSGVGKYVPEKVVENSYFDKLYNKDMDTFLKEKRNIYKRHFMSEEQKTSDLIVPAAQEALERANLTVNDIDMLIVATDTPDQASPSTSAVVQHKMKIPSTGTFDINSACAGFVSALDVASRFIQSDKRYKHILVCGAYAMSKLLNWDDYKITSLFADGAGAVVLSASTDFERGYLTSEYYTDGQFWDYMGVYDDHKLNFAKKIPLDTNTTHWPRMVHTMLETIDKKMTDVDHFFFTQINIELINMTMDTLGVDRTKAHNVMDQYGYTGSACIPMAIADAFEKKKLKQGDLCLLVSSGGGVSMAASAIEWSVNS